MTNLLIGVALGFLIGTTPFLIGNRIVRAKLLAKPKSVERPATR